MYVDPDSVFKVLNKYFPLNSGSVGIPYVYFGTKLKLMQLNDGVWAWGASM